MSLIVAVVSASVAGSFLCSLCEASLQGKPIVGEHDSHPQMQRLAKERARFRALAEDA